MKPKRRQSLSGRRTLDALEESDFDKGLELLAHETAVANQPAAASALQTGEAKNSRSSLPSAALAYSDFVVALKGALREFSRLDLLNDNLLLRSHLLASKSRAGPADLQALLTQTVETLFASPRDEKLRRVIDLTYFRPLPKQEAAA